MKLQLYHNFYMKN